MGRAIDGTAPDKPGAVREIALHQLLAMTKGGGTAMMIRVAKRLQLFLFLLQSFFLGKCLCALTYLISFTEQVNHAPQAHKENANANR
jgi:hypothetical protein